MRALIVLFAVFLLSGCAATKNPYSASSAPIEPRPVYSGPAWYRIDASAEQVSIAKEKAANSLKDPASAQFRNLFAISRGTGDDKVCGEINAKNSYGGYVGFRMFYVSSDGDVLIESNEVGIGALPRLVCDKPPKPM